MHLLVILSLAGVPYTGQAPVPAPGLPAGGPAPDATFYCQYDDGTATWFTWLGTSRAVWFNFHDFDGGSYAIGMDYCEFWFYHSTAFPWDTSSFSAEVWDTDFLDTSPVMLLDSQVVTAMHYSAVFSLYDPFLEAGTPSEEAWFWVVMDTGFSGGGWPSILSDGTASEYPVPRSYWSDDMVEWNPWEPGAGQPCDYLIRTFGVGINLSLQRETWGAVKALFD